MGMYDVVDKQIIDRVVKTCPFCHKEFDFIEWQTKSFENVLDYIKLEDLKADHRFEAHTICNNCNQYISVSLIPRISLEVVDKNF